MAELIRFYRDCWRYPLTLGSGTFQAYTGETLRAGSFVGGSYIATDNVTGTPISAGAALFPYVAARIQAALGSGTVTIRAADSVGEHDIGAERIVIRWSGGSNWSLVTNSNSAWFRALGFDTSQGRIYANSSGDICAPWSYQGAWWSHNPWGGAAWSKIGTTINENAYSSERYWDASAVLWSRIEARVFSYGHLPSARVLRGRSLDPNRARHADLALGDPNATFEPVWAALTNPATAVYVSHDLQPEDGLSMAGADRFEQVQLLAPWSDYGDKFSDSGLAGDWWNFEVAVRVSSRTYPF